MMASNTPLLMMVFLSLFLAFYLFTSAMMPKHYECTATINGQSIPCEVAP